MTLQKSEINLHKIWVNFNSEINHYSFFEVSATYMTTLTGDTTTFWVKNGYTF